MKVIQLLNEYEAYRSYGLRAKRLGRVSAVVKVHRFCWRKGHQWLPVWTPSHTAAKPRP